LGFEVRALGLIQSIQTLQDGAPQQLRFEVMRVVFEGERQLHDSGLEAASARERACGLVRGPRRLAVRVLRASTREQDACGGNSDAGPSQTPSHHVRFLVLHRCRWPWPLSTVSSGGRVYRKSRVEMVILRPR
jgi:hypothetical protein